MRIGRDEVNQLVDELMTEENRVVLVSGPEKPDLPLRHVQLPRQRCPGKVTELPHKAHLQAETGGQMSAVNTLVE